MIRYAYFVEQGDSMNEVCAQQSSSYVAAVMTIAIPGQRHKGLGQAITHHILGLFIHFEMTRLN